MSTSREAILADMIAIMREMTDWDYPQEMTRETRFFGDLGFESIDAVVFGESVETHYRRRFPYAEFLRELGEREQRDLKLGELVDFLHLHLNSASPEARREPAG
jgi:acyl carrier protein